MALLGLWLNEISGAVMDAPIGPITSFLVVICGAYNIRCLSSRLILDRTLCLSDLWRWSSVDCDHLWGRCAFIADKVRGYWFWSLVESLQETAAVGVDYCWIGRGLRGRFPGELWIALLLGSFPGDAIPAIFWCSRSCAERFVYGDGFRHFYSPKLSFQIKLQIDFFFVIYVVNFDTLSLASFFCWWKKVYLTTIVLTLWSKPLYLSMDLSLAESSLLRSFHFVDLLS